MTPTRAKRNSRVPERFSSDDIKSDTANGPTGQAHGDKANSVTKIKLKPIIREPLKVKLPKLKRLQSMQSPVSQGKGSTGINFGGTFAKIKLPRKRSLQPNDAAQHSDKPSQEATSTTKRFPEDHSKPQQSSDLNPTPSAVEDEQEESEPESECNSIAAPDTPEASLVATEAADRLVMDEAPKNKLETPASSGIRCPCGVDDDLGVMVECEKCSNWQHGHCINVGQEEDAYEGYVCAYCLLPPGRHNDSLHQLAINDKFQAKFEAMEAFMKNQLSNQNGCDDEIANENQIHFTYEDLEVATSDLKRVSNSLEVKCRLLVSDDYNAELRIWKNPIWSDDPDENRKQQQQTVRFVGDIYKSNLRLNICNMLNRMHKRCQLIRYQISRIDASEQECQSKFDKLLVALDGIASLVEKVTDNLKTI